MPLALLPLHAAAAAPAARLLLHALAGGVPGPVVRLRLGLPSTTPARTRDGRGAGGACTDRVEWLGGV